MVGRIQNRINWTLLLAAAVMLTGCAGGMGRRPAIASRGEPSLGDSTIVSADPPASKTLAFADRHPVISKPREVYDSTQGGKFTKTAAGAFIGVPMGIGGEIKQIFVGQPKAVPYP